MFRSPEEAIFDLASQIRDDLKLHADRMSYPQKEINKMIAIQVSGDMTYCDYRPDWRKARQLIDEFIEYVKQKGYRRIVRESREVIRAESSTGFVLIESGDMAPKGVRK